jgi:CRISPR system Cascade subunit CasA
VQSKGEVKNMPFRFNLTESPFIPCVMADGKLKELGLLDTLLQAHTIREIRDGSPLVTISLHRLLLAILHRIFGPASLNAWKELWCARRLDAAALTRYFERWKGRFDLFDTDHPFYQTAGMTTESPHSVGALFDELASGHNATLFDHSFDESPPSADFGMAARGLVARQSFAIGLGKPPKVWIGGCITKVGDLQDGPLTRGVLLLMRGNSLFETLLSNLSLYVPSDEDLPVWERDDPEQLMSMPRATGRLDLYTWQSRRLRLVSPEPGAPAVVNGVHFAQGRKPQKDAIDPLKPYYRGEKRGWLPFSLKADRGLWRDSAALLELAHDKDQPVAALNWVARATAQGIVPRGRMYSLDAIGLGTRSGKARSVFLWRHDRMPLPSAYLQDAELVACLRGSLDKAEEVGSVLRQGVWALASEVLAPGDRKPDTDRVRAMVDSLAPERSYWPRLEIPFRNLLVQLAGQADVIDRQQTLARWVCQQLYERAVNAFDEVAEQLDNSARMLRAVAVARSSVIANLSKVTEQYKEPLHGQNR